MFIFRRKEKSQEPQTEVNLRTKIEKFLDSTTQFLKTTTGAITSLTLLLGTTSGLSIAIGSRISANKACSNETLSIEHLQDEPLKTTPYEIKTEDFTVNMEISVYEDGDILTTYGTNREWLCFPEVGIIPQTKMTANSLIDFLVPQAVAQTTTSSTTNPTTYIQEQTLSPDNSQIIQQTRIYSDGTVEKIEIDTSTGTILNRNVSKTTITPELRERLNHGVELEKTTVIDVRSR